MFRRNIAEILERHKREPKLRDIYVEGPFDLFLYKWYLHTIKRFDIDVYEITTVDIPAELTLKWSTSNNNRGRVIALSLEILDSKISNSNQASCIIDRDFDFMNNIDIRNNFLTYTDFSCAEMYLFCEPTFQKFLHLNCKVDAHSASLIATLVPFLKKIFLIRWAKEKSEIKVELPPFDKSCTFNGTSLNFDYEGFLERYKSKGVSKEHIELIKSKVAEKENGNFDSEFRYYIHGHDFLASLELYVKEVFGKSIKADQMVGCIEENMISQHSLFNHLKNF